MAEKQRAPDGKQILTDPSAESANGELPAFLARPSGTPVYHGFPIVEETATDGWVLGAITAFEDPSGCSEGDAFVIAPDGTRAGLVWSVGDFSIEEVCAPTSDRWGVYSVAFPHAVSNAADLTRCFRAVLPELIRIHAKARSHAG